MLTLKAGGVTGTVWELSNRDEKKLMFTLQQYLSLSTVQSSTLFRYKCNVSVVIVY